MKVGFIGLGNMGLGMAGNLIKAGHRVTVYNRTRDRADKLQPKAAAIAGSPAEAAAEAEALITMLADDHAVEEVVLDPGSVLDSLPAGSVHISMSTISVALSGRLQTAHREKGQHYIAAPVFGRPDAAAAAKLFVVAAGPAEQVERCRPLFEAMGQRTFQAGEEAPSASLTKLIGNFMITTVIESLAEGFALGRKSGLDPNTLLEVLTGSLFTAPLYRNYGSMIASEKYEPVGFKMPLGLKDNLLLLSAAQQAAVPMPMASLVHDRFMAALDQGLGEADWAAIASISYRSAGLSGDPEDLRESPRPFMSGGRTMKINKIGIVGSGHIGANLGILLSKAGYEILYSSRHPDTLKDIVMASGPKACAGTVDEAIAFGDVIVLSVPLKAIREFESKTKDALKGKIVIDTSNPYPERDGAIGEEGRMDPGGMGTFVARLLPGARIIRAFNTVYFEDLKRTVNKNGERIGVPIAGDDAEGLNAAVELVEQAGLEPVVVGSLSTSKLFDVGAAVYATSAPAKEIREKLDLKRAA